jgi:hypothetical protein
MRSPRSWTAAADRSAGRVHRTVGGAGGGQDRPHRPAAPAAVRSGAAHIGDLPGGGGARCHRIMNRLGGGSGAQTDEHGLQPATLVGVQNCLNGAGARNFSATDSGCDSQSVTGIPTVSVIGAYRASR